MKVPIPVIECTPVLVLRLGSLGGEKVPHVPPAIMDAMGALLCWLSNNVQYPV